MIDISPIWLSLELALVTTIILFVISLPLAAFLSFRNFNGKSAVEAIISLPLVLPPSVLGFYLLVAFSPNNTFGQFLNDHLNLSLVFSFPGLVVGSIIYSLPFMVHPLQAGMQSFSRNILLASYSLGRSKFQTFLYVLLPNLKPAMLTGTILTFAHTLGEFGVVLMIGGNLPGKTRVASIAIYDEVESLNFHSAHVYSFILLMISFIILLVVYGINSHWFQNKDR